MSVFRSGGFPQTSSRDSLRARRSMELGPKRGRKTEEASLKAYISAVGAARRAQEAAA